MKIFKQAGDKLFTLGSEQVKLENGGLDSLDREEFALEVDIQKLVENNLQTIFKLQFVATEVNIDNFWLDTLAFDEERNSFVVIEFKKDTSYSVVDQGYSYLGALLNNKAKVTQKYNNLVNQDLTIEDIDWSSARVMVVSQSFTTYQKSSVKVPDVPFELWEIQRLSGDIITLCEPKSDSYEDKILSGKNSKNSAKKQTSTGAKGSYAFVDVVEIKLPVGTRSTLETLITPVWEGCEKWFPKEKLEDFHHDGECWVIRLPRKALKQRHLEHLINKCN